MVRLQRLANLSHELHGSILILPLHALDLFHVADDFFDQLLNEHNLQTSLLLVLECFNLADGDILRRFTDAQTVLVNFLYREAELAADIWEFLYQVSLDVNVDFDSILYVSIAF